MIGFESPRALKSLSFVDYSLALWIALKRLSEDLQGTDQ